MYEVRWTYAGDSEPYFTMRIDSEPELLALVARIADSHFVVWADGRPVLRNGSSAAVIRMLIDSKRS